MSDESEYSARLFVLHITILVHWKYVRIYVCKHIFKNIHFVVTLFCDSAWMDYKFHHDVHPPKWTLILCNSDFVYIRYSCRNTSVTRFSLLSPPHDIVNFWTNTFRQYSLLFGFAVSVGSLCYRWYFTVIRVFDLDIHRWSNKDWDLYVRIHRCFLSYRSCQIRIVSKHS